MKRVFSIIFSVVFSASAVFCSGCGENPQPSQEVFGDYFDDDVAISVSRKAVFRGYDGEFYKGQPMIVFDGSDYVMTWGNVVLGTSDMSASGSLTVSKDGFNYGEVVDFPTLDWTDEQEARHYFATTLNWHSKKYNKTMRLGIVQTVPKGALAPLTSNRYAAYCFMDEETKQVTGDAIDMPVPYEGFDTCIPHGQPIEYENGDVLMSFYMMSGSAEKYKDGIVLYSFDGTNFTVKDYSDLIVSEVARGYCEPSVVRFKDKYYLTLRTDGNGYVCCSDDGLHGYSTPIVWKFDDGTQLGSRNTKQRFICNGDALYLIYTRDNADNDYVFRNRAPLFIARVDEEKMCVVKSTEQVLVPNLGAPLSAEIDVCEYEYEDVYSFLGCKQFLITVSEDMSTINGQYNPEKYGSDNSVWIVKVVITTKGYLRFYK